MMKTYLLVLFSLLITPVGGYCQIDTLIKIDAYHLHVKIYAGAGNPILFESGGGLDHKQWDSIARTLHENLQATTIVYDRQGFGSSEIDTTHYHILAEVEGLEHAIRQLGYDQPDILLVSHSVGAFYSRLYANRNPGTVKGIVMLDPRIPTESDVKFAQAIANTLVRSEFSQEDIGWYYLLYRMASNSHFLQSKLIPSSIPVLTIMAEHGPFDTEEENIRFRSAQREFVHSRQHAQLQIARSSSHNIPQDRPNYVIAEVSKFYRKHLGSNK